MKIVEGDTVVLSASPVPGNEQLVYRTVDNLFKLGANVLYNRVANVHVRGHAAQEELKIDPVARAPEVLRAGARRVPAHGAARPTRRVDGAGHGELHPRRTATSWSSTKTSASYGERVSADYVYVDGLGVGDIDHVVLRDRKHLASDGMVVVILAMDKLTGHVAGRPEVVSRGFVDMDESDSLPGTHGRSGRARARRRRPYRRVGRRACTGEGFRRQVPVRRDAAAPDGAAGGGGGLVLAARTRAKSGARTRRPKAAVKAVGRRRGGQSAYATIHGLLLRRESIGVALWLVALLAIPWLVPLFPGLIDLRDRFVETFGLLVFVWIALLAYAGWLVVRDEQRRLWAHWKPWAIGITAALFLAGFFGFFRPRWDLGDVALSAHTAGGELGHRLAGNPVGVLAWLAIGIAAFVLAAPETAAALARETPHAAQTAWGWRIPHRIGAWARRSFEFIFPTQPAPKGSVKMPLDSVLWAQGAGGAAIAEEDEVEAAEPVQPGLFPELDPIAEADPEAPGVTIDAKGNRRSRDGWQLPSMDVLADKAPPETGRPDSAIRASVIEETLASFGVDAKVVQINEGPTVTQFGIEPGWDIKTRTVIERDKDNKPLLDKDGQPEDAQRRGLAHARPRAADNVARERPCAGARRAVDPDRGAGAGQAGARASRCRTPASSLVTLRSVVESAALPEALRTQQAHASRSGRASRANRWSRTWRACRTCSSRARPAPASPYA